MLNYFDGIFKIVNPKLYNSPYKKNIVKVYDVVKNYSLRCNLRYFFKLLSLRIIESKSRYLNNNEAGVYFSNTNTMMIPNNIEECLKSYILDHELFHVAGRIVGSKNFNEGFAESLTRKINHNQNNELYAYELEVFVVEFLNKIFDDGLYSVFFGNGRLYKYFKKKGLLKQIKSIDKIINLHNNRIDNIEFFIKYLYMIMYASRYKIKNNESNDFLKLIEKFKKEKDELKELKLDNKTFKKIKKLLNENRSFLYYLIPSLDDCYNCLNDNSFFNKYLEQIQGESYKRNINELYFIILILTNIAKKEYYTNDNIYDLFLKLASNKSSKLKDDIYCIIGNLFEDKNNIRAK